MSTAWGAGPAPERVSAERAARIIRIALGIMRGAAIAVAVWGIVAVAQVVWEEWAR